LDKSAEVVDASILDVVASFICISLLRESGLHSEVRVPGLLGSLWETKVEEGSKLSGHHRATVEKIFQHPVSHNIQWHDVLSLLLSVAQVAEAHENRFKVTLGDETETLDAPRGHDVDEQMVIDLRRMLKGAGISSESE
jgi:hypothetical protein